MVEIESGIHDFVSRIVSDSPRVSAVVNALGRAGSVALFGGAIRDYCLGKPYRDLDLVVATNEEIPDLIPDIPLSRNRFSGYRMSAECQIDVWRLADTWAFKNGLVQMNGLESLTMTTFMNSDAILYDITGKQAYMHPCFQEFLTGRVLDCNLTENPNPLGAAVRATRLALMHDLSLSPALLCFISKQQLLPESSNMIDKIFGRTVNFEALRGLWRQICYCSENEPSLPIRLSTLLPDQI